MTFKEYMSLVNHALIELCGMVAHDIPDWCYHDDYKNGVKPVHCARRAIKNARGI